MVANTEYPREIEMACRAKIASELFSYFALTHSSDERRGLESTDSSPLRSSLLASNHGYNPPNDPLGQFRPSLHFIKCLGSLCLQRDHQRKCAAFARL